MATTNFVFVCMICCFMFSLSKSVFKRIMWWTLLLWQLLFALANNSILEVVVFTCDGHIFIWKQMILKGLRRMHS